MMMMISRVASSCSSTCNNSVRLRAPIVAVKLSEKARQSSNNPAVTTYQVNNPLETKRNKSLTKTWLIFYSALKIMNAIFSLFNPTRRNRLPVLGDDLLSRPAHELSRQIKLGQLTSRQVVNAYITRAKQVQPLINAVANERFDEALIEADAIDARLTKCRQQVKSPNTLTQLINDKSEQLPPSDCDDSLWIEPLAGIPLSVKESIGVNGMINSCGVWNRRDVRAQKDATVVANARIHGLIPFVTTNVPELTFYWADCENPVHGRTKNPYDLSRVPGASSGGEGALIGAAGSLVGIGSDLAGSLRFPAHFCGIYSHKPTPYSVNMVGNWPEVEEHIKKACIIGPMSRYASDLIPMYKALLGPNDNHIREKLRLDEPVDLSKLTIYYYTFDEADNWTSATAGSNRATMPKLFQNELRDGIIKHFEEKFNCHTQLLDLSWYYNDLFSQWFSMMRKGPYDDISEQTCERLGMTSRSLILESLKMMFGASRHSIQGLAAVAITRKNTKRSKEAMRKRFEHCMKQVEKKVKKFHEVLGETGVLIVPTLGIMATKHREALLKQNEAFLPSLFNVLQVPASHATYSYDKSTGLPYGYTIAARSYNDRLTIAVAQEIERTFGGWVPPSSGELSKH